MKNTLFTDITTLIWPADAPIAQGIISLIGIMMVVGLWLAFRHGLRLHQEHQQITRAKSVLDHWETNHLQELEKAHDKARQQADETAQNANSSDFTPAPAPALKITLQELDSRLKELATSVMQDTHIRNRIEAIRRLRDRQVKVNLDTLQQLTIAKERTRSGIDAPKQIAAWVMMLGVIGTFIGLSEMVQQIRIHIPEGQLNIAAMTTSLKELRNVLTGMETAFSTSVAGMMAALACALAAFLVQRSQAHMFHHLETVTVSKLIPASVTALDDDSILERISIQMEQSFAHLDAITESNRHSLEEFSTTQMALQTIVADVQSILASEARQDVHAVIERLMETNQLVGQLAGQFPHVANALNDTNQTLNNGLKQLDATMKTTPVINPNSGQSVYAINPHHLAILVLIAIGWATLASLGMF